jgi:hypothetical protein
MRLPTDILHLILSYLSHNDYAGILKIRTICKEWKEVGDFSPLWLSLDLHITAPHAYLLLNKAPYYYMSPLHIGLFEKIKCLPKGMNKYFISTSNQKNTQLLPYEVSTNFLRIYRLCQQAWERSVSYHSFYKYFSRLENKYSQKTRKSKYIRIALLIMPNINITKLSNIIKME